MYIPFESLPGHARIWVYQAGQKMSGAEAEKVRSTQLAFCEQWEAHGQPLKTSFKIEYDQFLVIGVDEGFHNASGCSIDGSVRILKAYQADLGINFLDSSLIAFSMNDGIHLFPRTELKGLFERGQIDAATLTFNKLVATKSDFETLWEIPVEKSWMVKYLPKTTLSV
jgi:hypothetical protein